MTSYSSNSIEENSRKIGLVPRHGIIVYLDALGAKSFDKSTSEHFLDFSEGLWDKLSKYDLCYPYYNKECEINFSQVDKPDKKIFGDTLVYAWDLKDRHKAIETLPHIVSRLVPAIRVGLDNKPIKFKLRGAVSIGDYYDLPGDNSIILGPALVDAHEWHDQAEWMGIIATPTCGFKLSKIALDVGGNRRYGYVFWDYNVPIKGNKTLYLWTLSWPWAYYRYREDGRKDFFSNFAADDIPFEASAKYVNTQKYFNDYLLYFSNKSKLEDWRQNCDNMKNH